MTKRTLRPLTRREFWPTVAGIFSLVVSCSRRETGTKSPLEELPAAETRTITHALGLTRVPKSPQRIVALTGIAELEALLVVGVKPFAAAGDDRAFGRTVWQPHLKYQMQGVEMLPSRRNVSLEKVVTLQPDLIMGTASWLSQIYPQLSQIAPTVAIDTSQPWQDNLRLVAGVVGKTEKAEAWISAFEQRVTTLANTYCEAIAGTTYTTMFYRPDRRQVDLAVGHDIDLVFRQIGLTRPPEQAKIVGKQGDGVRVTISLERLGLIDTDIIFIYHFDYPTIRKANELPELNKFLEEAPLLGRLRAVEMGQVFIVPGYYWWLGQAIGVPLAVDDLEAAVLPLFTS